MIGVEHADTVSVVCRQESSSRYFTRSDHHGEVFVRDRSRECALGANCCGILDHGPKRRTGTVALVTNQETLQEQRRHSLVESVVDAPMPTRHGMFRAIGYAGRAGTPEQIALVHGDPSGDDVLVRVHSECLTGEAFGSIHCECGEQLDSALRAIVAEGAGVVTYLRGHEGRGIGLLPKLKAMRLQETGLDTVEANLALGLPVDARDYRVAAEILRDLGITSVRLLSNNPEKVSELERHGIRVSERVPLLVPVNSSNVRYLRAKRERLDHLLPQLDEVPHETA
ncbi:GTP cyclohydrolase II [Saccharomonospora sp. NB11]|uniref:GTP cyclohydrolase II n=1 Tax=Saccharomonospora sp. NB11 TaxID=1642298 RepID=UPI0027DE2E23|nr:GTP cyclohydrolase II [Saccharomonospora sp. NB11]